MLTTAATFDRYHLYLTRIMATLVGMCALCAFLYGAFLLLAVERTAAHTAVQEQINALTANLGTLEARYLAETEAVTPEQASALGFIDPKEVSTVYATPATPILTLRTQ